MTVYELYVTNQKSTRFFTDREERDRQYFQTTNFQTMLHWVGIMLDALKGTSTGVGVMINNGPQFTSSENL